MKRRKARRVIVLEGLELPALLDLGPPYVVETPVGWADLDDLVRHAPPSAVVLLDPYAGRRPGEAFPRLHDLLRRYPSLTVVAAAELRAETVSDVATLLEW